MREKEGLTFPLLVDADSSVIESFGILNRKQGKVPHPAVVIVDTEGVARFVHVDENFRQRPETELVIDAVRKVQSPQS